MFVLVSSMEQQPEIMTPDQAAAYLQVSRDTIYRYIRSGKLAASCLGRSYRIPKRNLDLLLWESRTQELPLREDH
jgi:excisionase family DNA binding protein